MRTVSSQPPGRLHGHHTLIRRFFIGGALVSVGVATEFGAQMLRMLVLARLLGPTEFGITVSLNAIYALVTMSTWLGVERFLIHIPDGHRRSWLGVAHTLTIAKGVVGAFILLALAWPTTQLLGIPEALGSFMALALVPLLAGVSHLRPQQMQRRQIFGPGSMAAIAGNLGGLAISIAAAFLLRDHRALVYGLCATTALQAVASHMLTRVPYRVTFTRGELRQALKFGVPMMLNGLALALLGQLDRLVVGAMMGVASLGRYGLAMTLVLTPISLLINVSTTMGQPHLSTAWHSPDSTAFPRLLRRMTVGFAILGTTYALGVVMLGDTMLGLIFGAGFAVGDLFMVLMSVVALVRIARGLAHLGGLSAGRTVDLMLSNVAGAFGLGITFLALWWKPTLTMATLGSLSGEVLGTLFIMVRLDRYFRDAGRSSPFQNFLAAIPLLGGVVLWIMLTDPSRQARLTLVVALLVAAGVAGWRFASTFLHRPEPTKV